MLLYDGRIYRIKDITNDYYVVHGSSRLLYLPKDECELL